MSYFHRYSRLSDDEAVATAKGIWNRINLVNLHENILPTRQRADLILTKNAQHLIDVSRAAAAVSLSGIYRLVRAGLDPPSIFVLEDADAGLGARGGTPG